MLKESNTPTCFPTAVWQTWTACQKNLACPLEIFSPILLAWDQLREPKGLETPWQA